MIFPAVVLKVIGFVDSDKKLHSKPIEGSNIIRCQIDNGQVIDINMYANNKEMNSLKDFIEEKAKKNVKDDKKKALMSDLLFDDQNRFEKELNFVKEAYPDLKDKQQFEKLAEQILFNENLIKQTSIFRMALAEDNNGGFNSRSIISTLNKDGELIYSQTGIYNHANSANNIPIEISIVHNKEGEALDFMQVKTSKIINAKQIKLLLEHSIRTLSIAGDQVFMLKFLFNADTPNILKSKLIEYNKIYADKKLGVDKSHLINLLNEIKNLFIDDNLYQYFEAQLPLTIDKKTFLNGMTSVDEKKGKSPIQKMRDAIINLNFNTENPDTKKVLKEEILKNYIQPLLNFEYNPKLLMTYNLISPNIFGESDSWGFMLNNLDFSKLTLGIDDQRKIIDYLKRD